MKTRLVIIFIMANLWILSAKAQEADWQRSYQLESYGKYSEAIAAIDVIEPKSHDGELKAIRRGWLFYLLTSYNESIREYRLAIERNNNSVDAHLGLLLPLLAQQRWREAELGANNALKLAPNNYLALLRLAIAQEGQRNWEGMHKTATQLVSAYPTDTSAYVYLARANLWLNNKKAATIAYKAVLSRYPDHLEAKTYFVNK
ncbi:MAG: tetratricopeptide repeat protein [Methylococcaceae bacterium]|nr:tetratricopeptide repeat protein [Methylococcaceae bacterium]